LSILFNFCFYLPFNQHSGKKGSKGQKVRFGKVTKEERRKRKTAISAISAISAIDWIVQLPDFFKPVIWFYTLCCNWLDG